MEILMFNILMFIDIIYKLLSEALLSFYPSMVKLISFPIINQLWGRLVVYLIISLFFLDWGTIWGVLFSWGGILLALVNVLHIYSSYVGFNNLESGVSYSIFYTYPLFILIFSGVLFRWFYLLPIFGVGLLTYSNWLHNREKKDKNLGIGILGIVGAMLTEVWLYFIVKKFGDVSKWNILFVAYLIPAMVVSLWLGKGVLPEGKRGDKRWLRDVILLMVGNGVIGAVGYYLRFYTIDKLSVNLYSGLSYFGIVMAYIYGWGINKERVGWLSLVGSLMVIMGGLMVGKN